MIKNYYLKRNLFPIYHVVFLILSRFGLVEHWLVELRKEMHKYFLIPFAYICCMMFFVSLVLLAQARGWNFMSSTAKPPLLALPSRISRYGVLASMVTCAAIHTGRGLFSPLAVNDHNCNNEMRFRIKMNTYILCYKIMLNSWIWY